MHCKPTSQEEDMSPLERFESQLSTPRQIAMERMHHLGLSIESTSSNTHSSSCCDGGQDAHISAGLPLLLVSLLEEAFESWSLFFDTIISSHHASSSSAPAAQICKSNDVKVLHRTINLISRTTQLDPTLGEEIARAGSQSICSRLIDQINKCTAVVSDEEDSDALVDLQDSVFEIYSPSAAGRRMAFTNDELRRRLPLIYNLRSVSPSSRHGETGQQNGPNNNDYTTTIFINQVTKRRQSAQADVGFVMWPSAIVLSRWLVSNPSVLQGKSVLELGAGCGLVGIAAARIMTYQQISNNEQLYESSKSSKLKQEVIITDVNELVLENIVQNINLNDVASVASVAKLDFYSQTGDNHSGKWIAGDSIMNGSPEQDREPVDVILAADIICQAEDAIAAAKTIHDALRPGGVALVVCANAEHRFGVEIFANECEQRGLEVAATDVAEMYDGELLSEKIMHSAAGYVDGMELTFFRIEKRSNCETWHG
mmetsp:Transcript_32894/g.69211  ORF Transcript_32894/g.69211 Transcript_32894/m.69211 type:complete len:484 (-) Transcript_32894:71-1522(-)|eukprot:CAMPEP_0172316314 /NCGR_PEP_ID=MMETSP1058-20130122/27756_1 /TAXON_ID=83371 /ORGANISM="Detonula confervacea, Strain CCMP 353" /LENGTH=483 /DNA_ID=CAMNT_0013030593 /DNA_START=78 /DNA_END=1529 /DNA_ORIENTATION=+